MKDEKVPLNARIPKELDKDISAFEREFRHSSKTAAICDLIQEGLLAKKEGHRQRRLFELVSLKTMFMLRAIAGERESGEEFVKSMDLEYEIRKEDIEQMLLDFGVSYDGE